MRRYVAAKARLKALGYRQGSQHWKAFWAGHRSRCRGEHISVCPYVELTQTEKDRGKRSSQSRKPWLEGHAASAGV